MDYLDYIKLREQNAPKITLAGIEFYQKELEELLEKNERYIVKFKSVFYLETANYKDDPKFKVRKVWNSQEQLTRRGRYCTMNYKSVNHLLGIEVFTC